jgi:hypothetical protein
VVERTAKLVGSAASAADGFAQKTEFVTDGRLCFALAELFCGRETQAASS